MKIDLVWKAIVLGVGMVISSSTFASIANFTGHWKNVNSNTRGITKLEIKQSGNGVTVHAWGKCHPQDCDWGIKHGVAYAANVSANIAQTARAVTVVFEENFKTTMLVLRVKGNRLMAESFTRFTDNSNRSNYTENYRFIKSAVSLGGGIAGGGIGKEDCIPFDYHKARVQKINNRWKITVGNMWLLDFETKQAEAEKVLRIIKRFRMNKQCFVGRPHPSFEYYLNNNKAPSGSVPGEDCVNFNLNNIQVKKIQNSWKIVDGSHWMFDFGNKEQEARKSFAVIKKYRFSQSCFVGRPAPAMSYLKR